MQMSAPGAFLADIKEIRRRARQHLNEGITQRPSVEWVTRAVILNP
jgi:hypothetical protein